jgi:hypothetical protein
MIGVVNDIGSDGIRDAVIGALQRCCDSDGICWRVADTLMIPRFDDAECTHDAGTQSRPIACTGAIDRGEHHEGGCSQW